MTKVEVFKGMESILAVRASPPLKELNTVRLS